MEVYILSEGGKGRGLGHITRCLSLYQAFEERGIKPKFIINGDNSVSKLLEGVNYEIIDWLKERQQILKKIRGSDIVIVDSYLADKEFYEDLSKVVKLPVYIDDNKRLDYPNGIVINGNIHAESLNYPEREGITYLLGTKYTPLRREFWKVPEKEIRNTVQSVMITFGGYDIRNMTPKVLKLLSGNYPKLKKNVIIGKGFLNVDEIKTVADENTNLIYYPTAEQMKQVMLDSDIAISAGGQTLYELARVGVPTIAVIVADNQTKSTEGWKKASFTWIAGKWQEKDLFTKIDILLSSLRNYELRKFSSESGRKLLDGKGSLRVVEYLCLKSKKGG